MSITSWTSNGMNWSAPTGILATNALEAIRLALLERARVIGTPDVAEPAYNWIRDGFTPSEIWDIARSVDPIIDGWLAVGVSQKLWLVPGSVPADLNGETLDNWNVTTSGSLRWSEATILADIGDPARVRLADKGLVTAEWAKQVYEILNRLYITQHHYERGSGLTENEVAYYGSGATVGAAVAAWTARPYATAKRFGLGAYRHDWGGNVTLYRSTVTPSVDMSAVYQDGGETIKRHQRVGVQLKDSNLVDNFERTPVDRTAVNTNSWAWDAEGYGVLGVILDDSTPTTPGDTVTLGRFPDIDASNSANAPSGMANDTGWGCLRSAAAGTMARVYTFMNYNVTGGFQFVA